MPRPSVLLDLDGTLVDRRRAFEDWARAFLAELGAGESDLAWLLAADENGYRPRHELTAAICDRFRPAAAAAEIEQRLQDEVVEGISCCPGVIEALRGLRAQGVELVLVTNGTVAQQTAKLERTGLAALLDAVVISEAVGVKKPGARIFALALGTRAPGEGTWRVGDHPWADMAGARAAGLMTAWVSQHQPWPHDWQPTLSAPSTAEVLTRLSDRC
jgi:HAD superfamily hydrolase (TIGR01549 family)